MSQTHHSDLLTEREQEVLTLIAAGLSNKAIAKKLFLSVNTVAWYVQQIFSKLQVKRRTQAVAVAKSRGLLENPTSTSELHPVPFQKKIPNNLPLQTTSFIGREKEICEISDLLNTSDCRLLTLVGQGGIGKTRLAIEVARQQVHAFADGVFFIALQPLTTADKIVPTIANIIGLHLQSNGRNPQKQLLDYLHNKSVLLTLDNFEHLIEAVGLVHAILANARSVKILLTSREALNLQEEFLYPVNGLEFPDSDTPISQERFSAIELFSQRARQIFPQFSLDKQWAHVVKICSLVDGIPLAIELATSWLKTLSCQEIVDEIQRGMDILVTPFRNIPERHRSMQAVFDYSWQTLSDEEREVFRALSVFRGGCTREAAQYIAETNIHILQSLVDKSFIRRDALRLRYEIHELMRQYGEYHLKQLPEEQSRIQHLHCQYYMQLLAGSSTATRNEKQYDLMVTFDAEVDNMRLAWNWAIEQSDMNAIQRAAQTYWVYLIFRSRFLEGVEAFEAAIHVCEEEKQNYDEMLAELKNLCAWFYVRLSRISDAQAMFRDSYQQYLELKTKLPIGWVTEPLVGLSLVEITHGNYGEAEAIAEQAVVACSEQRGMNLILACYVATGAKFHQGKYHEAQYCAEQAFQLCEATGELWVRAEVLNDLGRIARELGDYPQAKSHFEASLKIRKLFGDSQGIAAALNHLGGQAILDGDYQEAKYLYEECYTLYHKIGDIGGAGYALNGLGTVALKQGNLDHAQDCFTQALSTANNLHYAPLMFAVLIGISQIFLQTQQMKQSLELLSLTYHHEQSDRQAKDEAKVILNGVSDDMVKLLGQTCYETVWHSGQSLDLEIVVQEIIAHSNS